MSKSVASPTSRRPVGERESEAQQPTGGQGTPSMHPYRPLAARTHGGGGGSPATASPAPQRGYYEATTRLLRSYYEATTSLPIHGGVYAPKLLRDERVYRAG